MEECIWRAYNMSEGLDDIHKRIKWILAYFKLMSNDPYDPRYDPNNPE
jgi:hypothetical protein